MRHFRLMRWMRSGSSSKVMLRGVSQVPVTCAIAKGTLPIVGVTKERHVSDAAAAASVELTDAEVAELEALADSLDINAVRFWEKVMD